MFINIVFLVYSYSNMNINIHSHIILQIPRIYMGKKVKDSRRSQENVQGWI